MSKNPRPTPEELEFVYDLILNGFSDGDILNEYVRLDRNATLVFPMRKDKRFVKERRKELAAAEAALKGRVAKKVDPLLAQSRKEHFYWLTEIVNTLISNGLDKLEGEAIRTNENGERVYEIHGEGYTSEEIAESDLVGRFEGNMDTTCQRYGTEEVFQYFFPHFDYEFPAFAGLYDSLKTNPVDIISALRLLAQRKTFKGTCPVCEEWHS